MLSQWLAKGVQMMMITLFAFLLIYTFLKIKKKVIGTFLITPFRYALIQHAAETNELSIRKNCGKLYDFIKRNLFTFFFTAVCKKNFLCFWLLTMSQDLQISGTCLFLQEFIARSCGGVGICQIFLNRLKNRPSNTERGLTFVHPLWPPNVLQWRQRHSSHAKTIDLLFLRHKFWLIS